jgi:zinc transport system substrate-binding protein
MKLRRLLAPLAVLVLLPLAACGASGGGDGKPQVVAAFYPLEFVAQSIVGDHADVSSLAAPGVEPHDLDLKPRQVAQLSSASVVLVEKGLQPSVDDAIANDRPRHLVDAASVVTLREGDGGVDPHFWLDPTLLAKVADAFVTAISKADPDHAADYAANGTSFDAQLTKLDGELRTGLAGCRIKTLVVSHDAFEYFGRRYGLDVHAIAGLSPDAEPSAKHLAELADLARSDGVTTVFNETLASPALARTLADELGLRTAVLDPIEGITSESSSNDYLGLQRDNLAALRKACA